jgi:predicted  nucleic acid-binding Zn-ribbon protein
MTLKQGNRRLLAPLLCAAAVLCGCKKTDRAAETLPAGDAKAQIHNFLAKKTGQKNFTPGMDLNLGSRVATLQSNASVLEQRTGALRASLRAADGEQGPLQKEIVSLRSELVNTERQVGEARKALNEIESRVPPDASEIAARRSDYAAKESAWTKKRQEFSAKEAQLEVERTAQKQKFTTLEKEFQEAERAWELARAEAMRNAQELSRQDDNYIRATREQMAGVRSYEALYRVIGEQLATADELLAEPELSRRRIGLRIAREACGNAMSDSVDVWLAARICEAYFWPNLEVADPTPGSRERAIELLEISRRVFFDTFETNNVLKNYSLLLSNAPNASAADTFRVQLADWLEEKGDLKRAAEVLNEIRDAQILSSAQERITRVKERVAAIP